MKYMCGFVIFIWSITRISAGPEPSIDSQPPCKSGKLDLVLVVDVSGSLEHKFTTNRDAALEISRALPIGWDDAIIAVIQYSQIPIQKLELGSSQTKEIINDTLFNLDWTGGVAFGAEAMDLAMIQFRRSRSDSQRVIILFSDGNSLDTWTDVQATAERLHYSKSKIYAVSLNGATYEPELKAYIGSTNGSIIKKQDELEKLKQELLQYTVASCKGETVPKHVDDDEKTHNTPKSKKGTTANKHGTTKHLHVSSTPKTTTVFVAFPKKSTMKSTGKKSTISAKATTRSTSTTTTMDPDAQREAIEKLID